MVLSRIGIGRVSSMSRSNLTRKATGRFGCASVLLLTVALLIGPAHATRPEESWQTTLGWNHPLTGRIWEVSAASFIDAETLVKRLAHGRFILLGEKHDNPDHHRLQTWLVRGLIAAGRRPAVGFEMFSTDDGPALARHLAATPTDAAGLGDAVNWRHTGWPDWALYQPIAEAALGAKLPIIATNLPQATARALSREGVAALNGSLVSRLGLDRPLPPEAHAEMVAEIRDAHCGYAAEERIEAMITVQRARDGQMAERLVAAAAGRDGVVLIAGAEHVRNDRGIPAFHAFRAPDASMISLAFLEVRNAHLEPTAYAATFGRRTLPFDYVWFTPRLDDLDPCAKFSEQLKRFRERKGAAGDH